MSRLTETYGDLRQSWLSRRYLLTKIAEKGFSINTYLRQKQLSQLDAMDEQTLKKKPGRKKGAKKKTSKRQ